MNKLLKIPRDWRILSVGEIRRKGDRFKKENGRWSKTSDYGSKVRRGTPSYAKYPEYAGIYIRRLGKRTCKKCGMTFTLMHHRERCPGCRGIA